MHKKPLSDLKGVLPKIQNNGLNLYSLPIRLINPKWQHFLEYRTPLPRFYHL